MSDELTEIVAVEDTDPKDLFVVRKGRQMGMQIHLRPTSPMRLSKVLRSIPLPDRPVYETKTVTGRTQVHAMDEVSARETPGGEADWDYYKQSLQDAQTEQNERVIMAILVMGTQCELPSDEEDDWKALHIALGIDVPTHPDLQRAHYLMTELDPEEMTRLIAKIMKLSGVSEEVIEEAESSFRGEVRNGSEPARPVANARPGARSASKK